MTTQRGPRTVWTVLFGETIMTWPRIAGQQLLVLCFISLAVNASHDWFRWMNVAVAVTTQAWIGYDAMQRLRATHRARHPQAPTSRPTTEPCPDDGLAPNPTSS